LPSNVCDAANQQVVGHFGEKNGEKGIDRCKPNFNTIWETHGLLYAKEIMSSAFEHNAGTERDRQTRRQTDHLTVTSIAIGEPRNQSCQRIKV